MSMEFGQGCVAVGFGGLRVEGLGVGFSSFGRIVRGFQSWDLGLRVFAL